MNSKVILLGMMGSGKSTISKCLSEKLNIKRYDLDEIFEFENKISISDFFASKGETAFREKETEILKAVLRNGSYIVSTGGGIILKEENRNLIFKNEIKTIYLKTSPDKIFERIKNDTTRPLLKVENPKKEIEKIINERNKYYSTANFEILTDDKTPLEIAEEIIKKL